MVPGEPNGGVTPVTTAAGVTAQTVTPSTTPVDAETVAQATQRQAELESQLAKTNQDLNRMKSTFQRSEAELKRGWEQREREYQQQLENLKVSGMDEDQRKAYEASSTSRRLAEMEQQMAALEDQKVQTEAMFKAQNYFISQGVPASELNVDEGYEELWNSGMGFITQEFQRLKNQSPVAQTPQVKTPVAAPAVVTTTNTPAYTGPTWDELVKKYGSEEEVYRLVETQRLDPTTIPVPR